jgi:tellurite resistance protein
MSLLDTVAPAIDELCDAFDKGGYNPTPIIDLGVLVAYADGRIDDREHAMLSDVFGTLLGTTLNSEVVDALVTASVEVIKAAGAEERARLVGTILKDCDAGEPGLVVALALAFASEGLSENEQRVVDRIAEASGISNERLGELTKKVRTLSDRDPVSVRNLLATGNHKKADIPGDAERSEAAEGSDE